MRIIQPVLVGNTYTRAAPQNMNRRVYIATVLRPKKSTGGADSHDLPLK